MKICRKRWVIMRNNRTEIWGGCTRDFHFNPVDNVGDFAIKTYLSEKRRFLSVSVGTEILKLSLLLELLKQRCNYGWPIGLFNCNWIY